MTQKKIIFFLRELSVYLVFAERRIPANWRVVLVLSNLFAAMLPDDHPLGLASSIPDSWKKPEIFFGQNILIGSN